MDSDTQLLKGTLDGCLLLLIGSHGELYGYELSTALADAGLDTVRAGSIYPALLRLERDGMVASELRESSSGPTRKYYSITPEGARYAASFLASWQALNRSIINLERKFYEN